MFSQENSRRLSWQLLFLIIFWSIVNIVMIVQVPRLLVNETTGQPTDNDPWASNPFYDPWKDDPWEFNLVDRHMSILESYVVLLSMLYGFLRLVNIIRIIHEDEQESLWSDFWGLCESLST